MAVYLLFIACFLARFLLNYLRAKFAQEYLQVFPDVCDFLLL